MQYIIMFLIVLGLAFTDFVTGYIKARCTETVSSKALRIGGLHKVSELCVMLAAEGLTVGLEKLPASSALSSGCSSRLKTSRR